MSSVAQLSAKVDELQQAIDSEQTQIGAALSTLQSTVDGLKQELIDAGSPAERQAVADKLDAAITDVSSTIADAAPAVEPISNGSPPDVLDSGSTGGTVIPSEGDGN